MVGIIGFLIVLAIIGAMLYLLVIQREVPGVVEQRFGVLEPLPGDIGVWNTDELSDAGKAAVQQGLRRETRLFYDPHGGFLGAGRLIRQTRYRNPATGTIVRVEADEHVPRRRIRK